MMLLYRDKSKPELWAEREVEGVGTLNYYIGPGIDEEMMDYILDEVEGVTDYEGGVDSVSYTHLDVYKRQEERPLSEKEPWSAILQNLKMPFFLIRFRFHTIIMWEMLSLDINPIWAQALSVPM